jgi:hypothetical protein
MGCIVQPGKYGIVLPATNEFPIPAHTKPYSMAGIHITQ